MDIISYVLSKQYIDDILLNSESLKGKSAYEIAVEYGFEGSEAEWLESLKGESPYIGENGNWFIGDTDLGILASYEDIINSLTQLVNTNEEAIATLNGNVETKDSVDYKIAQAIAAIMENPDETINSINELVAWINQHADNALILNNQVMTNTNNINTLASLVGDETVETQIINIVNASSLSEDEILAIIASDED